MNRRKFLKTLGVGAAAAVVAPTVLAKTIPQISWDASEYAWSPSLIYTCGMDTGMHPSVTHVTIYRVVNGIYYQVPEVEIKARVTSFESSPPMPYTLTYDGVTTHHA